MKRFNDFLFQKTCGSVNGQENTGGDDDKKTGMEHNFPENEEKH